jgi:hypothetical protein
VSTAFESAFKQREDYVCFHEPFTEPFFISPDRVAKRFSEQECARNKDVKTTFSDITNQILNAESEKKKKVFVKEMARYVIRSDYKLHPENPTFLPVNFLKSCKHTFLLRTPEKAAPSDYRCDTSRKCGMDQFSSVKVYDPNTAGYCELQVLFNFLAEMTGARPLLMDSDDLLQHPKTLMTKYCEAIQDRFELCMLEWKAEKIEAFKKRRGYHENAEQSTEFNQIVGTRKKDDNDFDVLPDIVCQMIKKNMPIYEALRELRIRA